jgi:hypothetical protein
MVTPREYRNGDVWHPTYYTAPIWSWMACSVLRHLDAHMTNVQIKLWNHSVECTAYSRPLVLRLVSVFDTAFRTWSNYWNQSAVLFLWMNTWHTRSVQLGNTVRSERRLQGFSPHMLRSEPGVTNPQACSWLLSDRDKWESQHYTVSNISTHPHRQVHRSLNHSARKLVYSR